MILALKNQFKEINRPSKLAITKIEMILPVNTKELYKYKNTSCKKIRPAKKEHVHKNEKKRNAFNSLADFIFWKLTFIQNAFLLMINCYAIMITTTLP